MENNREHLYEGMYILNSNLSEDARKKALGRIEDGITEKGGKIEKVHEMGRKRLAYPIDGKKEGYYYVIYFTVVTSAMKEIWKEYHLNEDLLRFMTPVAECVRETLEFKPLQQQN
jgi:small subunit ribosomal protein S6